MFFHIACLTFLLGLPIYWFMIRLHPGDSERYENLVNESVHLRTRRALEEEPAHQKRQNVHKSIWTKNETHYLSIMSQESDLTISQKKDKIEAIEKLKEIRAITPDDFTLLADEGIYNCPSHQFTAQKNCKLFQGDNQIEGTKLYFDLNEKIVQYENPKGSTPLFNFTAKTLFWDKRAEQLHLIDEVVMTQSDDLTLLAQNGTVYFNALEPKLVTLDGNVRLISTRFGDKESFAIAERLTYNPANQTLLFSSDRKVLFWQDGFALSASEVEIFQDQTVKGHGDVHFTFDLEEQNYIDQFFKHYL